MSQPAGIVALVTDPRLSHLHACDARSTFGGTALLSDREKCRWSWAGIRYGKECS